MDILRANYVHTPPPSILPSPLPPSPFRVSVTLLPDADLSKKMEAEEKAKIEQFRKSLSADQVGGRVLGGKRRLGGCLVLC